MVKEGKDQKVTLFGEDFTEERFSRHHGSGGVFWGVFLIFCGSLLLLNSFGVIPWEAWNDLFSFWPVLLILSGVQIILGGGGFARIITFLLSIYLFGSAFLFVLSKQMPSVFSSFPQEVKNSIRIWEVIKK